MKVTLNWLRQHVAFDWPPAELAERLTMLGLEVEGVERLGGELAGVVVAQVLTRDKHPNADKLSVCRVADGMGERQIVCGAQNFQPGDKVPLILPGASLPPRPGDKDPFTIKVGKIRGVESHGMLCSADELGLDAEALGLKKEDGLLILRPDATVGQSFAEHLGRGGSDVVYDLEVTPNRPDLNSVIGIAREIAALTGNELKMPAVSFPPSAVSDEKAADLVAVRLDAPDLCPRYTARVVRGVKVGPSPDWLRAALEKVGLRSINNVVDVTNFVMLETGQPLHAFDYHLLAKDAAGRPTIVVRRAAAGEKFTTLDGKEHTLTPENLLIADAQKGIALAGVMGGLDTEILPTTTDVLLESAHFAPTNIRRTSKSLGLRTDASYRFERGADLGAADDASRRCAQLILETAGGTLADGVVDAFPAPPAPRQITLRHAKANALLGLNLRPEEMEFFLGQLGLKPVHRQPRPVDDDSPPAPATFAIPTWRVDLKRETDLIEEIARLYGVDKIPATPPRGALGAHAFDAVYDQHAEVRRLLAGLGLDEAQGQTLVSSAECGAWSAELVRLANPLSSDMDVLRPSLLPGLLDTLRHNAARRNTDARLFELGRVFARGADGAVREGWRVAVALTGARQPAFWTGAERDAKCDLADLKGLLEELLDRLGLRGVAYAKQPEATPFFVESAAVTLGGKLPLGQLGQLQPAFARRHDLRDAVLLAELDLGQLLARRNPARSFKPLPQFPAARRDVALLVPEAVTHDAVLQAVRQAKPANLEAVELFDVFRGKHVPAGQKSLAYAFTYRAADRTLKDDEVNAAQAGLVEAFRNSLGASLRD
jgi:phenylalanyl-tRNA synthetase beta chain